MREEEKSSDNDEYVFIDKYRVSKSANYSHYLPAYRETGRAIDRAASQQLSRMPATDRIVSIIVRIVRHCATNRQHSKSGYFDGDRVEC